MANKEESTSSSSARVIKAEEVLYERLKGAVTPHIRRVVFPETTYADGKNPYSYQVGDIGPKSLALPRYTERHGKPPLKPRERLSARLGAMLALTRLKNELMKEILADKEAIEDAKKHKEQYDLEELKG